MVKNLLLGSFFVFALFLVSSTPLNILATKQIQAQSSNSTPCNYTFSACSNISGCFWYAGYNTNEYPHCAPTYGETPRFCSTLNASCYQDQACGSSRCVSPDLTKPGITDTPQTPDGSINSLCNPSSSNCQTGLTCQSTGIISQCLPPPNNTDGTKGSLCDPNNSNCQTGLSCQSVGTVSQCLPSYGTNEYCTKHSDCPSGEFCISNDTSQTGSSSCVGVKVGTGGSICEDYTEQILGLKLGVDSVCASQVCGSDLRCTGTGGPSSSNTSNSCTDTGVTNYPTGTFTCDTSANPCTGPNEVPYTGPYSSCTSGVCCKNNALYGAPPNNSGSTSTSPSPSTSTSPSSQTPDPQGQPCVNHGRIKNITAGCGTVTNNVANITTFDANKAATGQFCSLSYIDTYVCNDGYTGDYLVQTTPTNQCTEAPWCPVGAATPSPSGTSGNGTGGTTTPPSSTTPGDCTSVTFPAPNNQTAADGTLQAAYNKCDALSGCFVYVAGVNSLPQCLPTSLEGPTCGNAFCMKGDVCQTDTPYAGYFACAKPEGLGQNCGDGYGLANPNCDTSQNLVCADSHTCQYADSSIGAPTPTPGVSYQQGGVGRPCGAGGKQTTQCSGQLGCFPGMGNASIVGGSVQYYCVASGQEWCPSTQTSMPSNGICPNTASGGNGSSTQPAVPTATPASVPVAQPTATTAPKAAPQTVCGNSANQMQGNQPCNNPQYVPEPTLTTAQYVAGCNNQYPYHFSCN